MLNSCPTMLNQGRYTWRHNSIVNHISNIIRDSLTHPSAFEIYADLPGQMKGISTIPSDILVTIQKPDLVIIDKVKLRITIIEITIPFDTNVDKAHERKIRRYQNLVDDLNRTDYTAEYLPIEIGSRGCISNPNSHRIKDLFKLFEIKAKETNDTLKHLSKIAIVASYIIFYSKFENLWTEPNFVTM